ncbi:MAG: hypothetical protein V7K68_01040 [Nostoc sp.]|uniref:hypothetical protein n=1 Tax=Nostoc sp. TaxID=1180 RepID=UPI002FF53AF4
MDVSCFSWNNLFFGSPLEQIYPQIITKIQFELSVKPSKAEKEATGKSSFVLVAARSGY